MPSLALDHLDPHPANANRMAPAMFAKLKTHIERTGEYPPLVVRHNPLSPGRFQILDGHHRAQALRGLGYEDARCDIWEVHDDDRAALLLLTLNRLHGEDDPRKRGLLLEQLHRAMDVDELAELLPDDHEQIRRLIAIAHPPEPEDAVAPPPDADAMPQAITFFLTGPQHDRLERRLREAAADRSAALLKLLAIES